MEIKQTVTIQLTDDDGQTLGAQLVVPLEVNSKQLQQLTASLIEDESVECNFFVDSQQISASLQQVLELTGRLSDLESVIPVIYQPQAIFKVQAVTRCTSSVAGHDEAIISVAFSPSGRFLASGSGDKSVRFWDLSTETPHFVCEGHTDWVLVISWSGDERKLASGCKSGKIILWDPITGKQVGKILSGHKKWITGISWEPLHRDGECRRFASSSKDGDVRIWDSIVGQCLRVLSGHTASVTCLRWGGENLIYSASQDRTIRVWRPDDGVLCRKLEGHGHWVNTMALNTDYIIRVGAFDPAALQKGIHTDYSSASELQAQALLRYRTVQKNADAPERLVTGSDDFTLFLWSPASDKKPIARMTGHQQLVNQVLFSPDARLIASASFDKSIKLWSGTTGKFIGTLRGHVQPVYQIAWSADSRLLVSGSADSTLKLWDMATKKLAVDLPGHADEVYSVDWSPDGEKVASGGKDRILKLWRK